MNLGNNIKTFSSFGNVISLLSTLITVMKILAGMFLAVQVIMLFLDTKSKPINEVIKLS